MRSGKDKTARRGFLLGAGTAGVAGAAAIATRGIGGARQGAVVKPGANGRGGGYHVTDHVRSYYRTTKV
ncbi:MAG: formate dehydrogenase [Burkholderiaceae bacterium]|nr:formate dehydrogenase [Burkholderiaceae bacterium]